MNLLSVIFFLQANLMHLSVFYKQSDANNLGCLSHSISHVLNIKYDIEIDPMPLFYRCKNKLNVFGYDSELRHGIKIGRKTKKYYLSDINIDDIQCHIDNKNPIILGYQPTNSTISVDIVKKGLCTDSTLDKYIKPYLHAVVIIGYNNNGYYVVDSAKGIYHICTAYLQKFYTGLYELNYINNDRKRRK